MKVYIARHGHRADDPANPAGAQLPMGRPLDPDISSIGMAQATSLGKRLKVEAQVKVVYSSPFLRTAHTAHLADKEMGCKVRLEWGIAEAFYPQWFSEWPGTTERQKLAAMFDTIDLSYSQTGVLPTCPEADQWRTNERLVLALAKLGPGLGPDEDVLLVTHALPMVLLHAALAGWGGGPYYCYCCSLSCVERVGGKWVTRLQGDGAHLQAIGLYL
jgi:broad specificity phosphatase PhoE